MMKALALTGTFDPTSFANPESLLWPGAFWLWNAPLEPERIRAQLEDMATHGLRSVCMLPMPHAFRPDNTNNSMDPDYLTPAFFDRVRLAVEEAARLGMNWWLYDEGGWPSGQALGKVTDGHPEFGQCTLVRERIETQEPYRVPDDAFALVVEAPAAAATVVPPGSTWTPAPDGEAWLYRRATGGYVDLLNPDVTKRFLELTHEGYRKAIGEHFGKTVRFTFTDEPSAPNLNPPKSIPWTPGMEKLYAERFGGNIGEILRAVFTPPTLGMPPADARARINLYDLWTGRFRQAYFLPIRDWCRDQGLASGGHLNGEDETINAIRYGFGQPLRQLRAMDVPGVDLIWRQLFPGRPGQHFFPKYASSAAHHNGTRYAFTESFCVYGNGLTPAQMKWLVDYQYVRGINLLVIGCFPFSTRDHHMTGERPHWGPVDPLWDHLPGFHAYVARLGYALSTGKPEIRTALYYPARDMWALGAEAAEAVKTHDQLAQELFERQCDFDLIDDDLLADPATQVADGELIAGAMRYATIVCGSVCWMDPLAKAALERFALAGGAILCVGHAPGTNGEPGKNNEPYRVVTEAQDLPAIAPTVLLTPPTRDIRATARITGDGEILLLFNEGEQTYEGSMPAATTPVRLDPHTGRLRVVATHDNCVALRLEPGESCVLMLSTRATRAEPLLAPTEDRIPLEDTITAHARRRFVAGEHDFETETPEAQPRPFAQAAKWRDWLTEDFSGEVDYRAEFDLPASWADAPLELETGPIDYAASVLLDGAAVGGLLWAPWRIELTPCKAGRHELVIRVANTLANELTSERVATRWAGKSGPGWPSPYHKRALEFERESRGGGMQGPICLRRMKSIWPQECGGEPNT